MSVGWLHFWEANLVISGVAFCVITGIVAIRGFGDLRRMMSDLGNKHPEKPE
jgi:hypothetical protein